MGRPDAITTARRLVHARFPDARQAWLSGSTVVGGATSTSDLDVTVLLEGAPAPYRESMAYAGWPVELFVHTADSVRAFVAKDLARRRPTMTRLVATGVALLDSPAGAELARDCAQVLQAGPGALSQAATDAARYALTDLLDDLEGGGSPEAVASVVVATWSATAELLLAAEGRWWGTAKWLVRELQALDVDTGTSYAARLHAGLVAGIAGDPGLLTAVADEVLDRVGGRLWVGYRASAAIDAS